MSGLSVRVAAAADGAAWDQFADHHGSFFHRFGWAQAVEATYGHQPIMLMAERNDELVGILPLIDRRSMFFGRALISTAFTVGGGVVAVDLEAKTALANAAVDHAQERGAEYVELRSTDDQLDGWHEKHGIYDNFATTILPDEKERLLAIPRKKRADIRKAIKAADAGSIVARTTDDLKSFWSGYARAQRDHGTPIFPLRWLEAQKDVFGDAMEVTLVEADGRALAGVVSYYERDRVLLYSAFISEDARRYHAGDYLYWWMMGRGRERGVSVFDLGRSKRGTGSHAYKTYWGFAPEPMVYIYRLMNTDEVPNVNPQNPKFALLARGWRQLPLPVANRLGPLLAGHLA